MQLQLLILGFNVDERTQTQSPAVQNFAQQLKGGLNVPRAKIGLRNRYAYYNGDIYS